MYDNTDTNNMKNNSILKIETLKKEYNIILNEYEEAYKNYINSKNEPFIIIPDKKYSTGDKVIKEKSLDECINICNNDNTCLGATFNMNNNDCYTSNKMSQIINGEKNEYALVKNIDNSKIGHLLLLNYLNNKLITLNEEIMNEKKNTNIDNRINENELNSNYLELLNKKENIENFLNMETNIDNQELFVNQEYMTLKIWLFITFIILLITFNQLFMDESITLRIIFNIIIVIILIVLSLSLHTLQGFVLSLLILLFIILYLLL
jgi:hypothetical protein